LSRIAIVGGGFSGVLQAIQLLRHTNLAVTLIERTGRLARGAAYSTRRPEHLLNVRAGRMSAFPDVPDHFARWFEGRGGTDADFAQRRLYGQYIEELLSRAREEAGGRLSILNGEVVDVARTDGTEQLRLADDSTLSAERVILSIGNLAPEVPRGVDADALGDRYVSDPWAGDIAEGLQPEDKVLLIGTGLTAVDAAMTLDAAGFTGEIVALSRRGLVPRSHAGPGLPPPVGTRLEPRCTSLLRFARKQSEAIGWHGAVDQLRTVSQALWGEASLAERRRFLRHLRPWWDVHRHRIAPEIAGRLADMEREGRLRFKAGRLLSADADGVRWRPRGSAEVRRIEATRIINCTGPQGDVARAGERLLDNLLKAGRIRPDACQVGIDVDRTNRVLDAQGRACDSLLAIGPMTRGAWWEIIAVPDIRVQLAEVARQLAR
jgi:uncharacterized NAD(P)/FAD-binding protein YdhS